MLDSLLHNSGLQPALRSSGGLNTYTSNMRQWFCSAAALKQASELPQNGDLDRVILLLVLVREAGRTWSGLGCMLVQSDVLACMEDVQLAEMWSQGVFINRRHGLAVVVVVLQS